MGPGTIPLLVALALFAALMLAWNLCLMQLLDVARRDVQQLAKRLHQTRPPADTDVLVLEALMPAPRFPTQRRPDGA